MKETCKHLPTESFSLCVFLPVVLGLIVALSASGFSQSKGPYFPPAGEKWEHRTAAEVGLDPKLLAEAVEYARQQAEKRTTAEIIKARQRQESHPEIIGPVREHGGNSGIIIRHGYIVAEFGDTAKTEMVFSATKSFLSAVTGLAYDKEMIPNLDEPIAKLVKDGGFDSPHNAKITWRNMLNQTSEWDGWLWEKPSTIDEPKDHKQQDPGTFWNYNDVRVNRLSLAVLRLWKKPLPEILREKLMGPIGASNTWIWNGYRNSEVEIDGKKFISVSGGGHWGGGMFISSRDLARFGLLFLNKGKWKGRQLISQKWVELMTTPCPIKNDYGFLWWLNKYPGDQATTFAARGAGGNEVWVDPNNDLVVVLEWAVNHNEIYKRVRAAVVKK